MSVFEDLATLIEDGAGWLQEVVDGPLRDWARTEWGATILRAMATSLSAGLAPTLGPQLASVAFALPGIARGEPFDEAYWKEFAWRVEKTIEIAGPFIGERLGNELRAGVESLRYRAQEAFPDLPVDQAIRHLGIAVEDLARELGIREDMAAAAVSLGTRVPLPSFDRYDPTTGARRPLVSVRQALAITHTGGSIRSALMGQGAQESMLRWLRAIP
ncbi:MAG: hypothetical protein AB7J63_13355 [Vicinamibacterales bacterium]